MAQKYRVAGNFLYRGPDGSKKQGVVVSPGENVPKLDNSELERLLRAGSIVKIDMYGENIPFRKTEELDDSKIDMLLHKKPHVIKTILRGAKYSEDSLGRLYAEAEKRKMPSMLLDLIESKIKG